jgi:hypothetical protein
MKRINCLLLVATLGLAPLQLSAAERARSVRQVDVIWINSNSCMADIKEELLARGFDVTNSLKRADAILDVNLYPRRARYGETVSYTAMLRGRNERVLLDASGIEESRDYFELCEDISDDIADRLDSRVG